MRASMQRDYAVAWRARIVRGENRPPTTPQPRCRQTNRLMLIGRPVTTRSTKRILIAGVVASLLVTATARGGVAAPPVPPAELRSEVPVEPLTASQPARTDSGEPRNSEGLSSLVIFWIAFGLAAAGTALVIVVGVAVRTLGKGVRTPARDAVPTTAPARRAFGRRTAPVATREPKNVEALQPAPQPVAPAEDDLPEETCTIEFWQGFVKSRFTATTIRPDGTATTLAASPSFRAQRGAPLGDSAAARAAYETLVAELAELGWRESDVGGVFVRPGRNQSA